MQIALNQLAAHLQKGLRPLYTLHGDEAFGAFDDVPEWLVVGSSID